MENPKDTPNSSKPVDQNPSEGTSTNANANANAAGRASSSRPVDQTEPSSNAEPATNAGPSAADASQEKAPLEPTKEGTQLIPSQEQVPGNEPQGQQTPTVPPQGATQSQTKKSPKKGKSGRPRGRPPKIIVTVDNSNAGTSSNPKKTGKGKQKQRQAVLKADLLEAVAGLIELQQRNPSQPQEVAGDSSAVAVEQSQSSATAAPQKEFRCGVCNKTFESSHAYGGHRSRHGSVKGCAIISRESSPNNTGAEGEATNTGKKKGKSKNETYECPECGRIFPNSSAFGGHRGHHSRKNKKNASISSTSITIRSDAAASTTITVTTVNQTSGNDDFGTVGGALGVDLNLPVGSEEDDEVEDLNWPLQEESEEESEEKSEEESTEESSS